MQSQEREEVQVGYSLVRGWSGVEQAPKGSGCGTELLEFEKCLHNA